MESRRRSTPNRVMNYLWLPLLTVTHSTSSAFQSFSTRRMRNIHPIHPSSISPQPIRHPTHFHAHSLHDNDAFRNQHTVKVTFEGQSCMILVFEGESILSALERTRAGESLCLPIMPNECRKGSCLTCAGKHQVNSNKSNLNRGEDGVAPNLSEEVEEEGYVLTCSSFVSGSGVELELGLKEDVWQEVYVKGMQKDSERMGREVAAKTMRLAAERNVSRWKEETELALERPFEFE